jgi:hypothetical protein
MSILETQAVLDRSSQYIRAQRYLALTRAASLHNAQHHVIQANRIYTELGMTLPFLPDLDREWPPLHTMETVVPTSTGPIRPCL